MRWRAPRSRTGVTAEVWECVRRRAAGVGLSVPPGERGSVRDAGAATLAVTFTRSPSWIGCGAMAARVRKAAAGCGAR
jgi:hypothetical protein